MDLMGKYIAKRTGVIGKEIQSKSVLLNLDNGTYYTLNKTGTFIWSLLDQKREVNYLIERVTQRFDIDKDKAYSDVQVFIEALKDQGLIDVTDEPA